ncbi:MAG: AMIN domain-containing protein [Clostridiales bacterium]|nr:AMIN domain-containing protein [Clostridiales bacterium]
MGKKLRILMLIGIIIILGSGFAFANNKVSIQLDGEILETDVDPMIINDRTMVPYRAVLEAMGAEVSWEPSARMATAILGSHRVQVTIDQSIGFVNGKTKSMDVPPLIVNSRTLIPLRFVLENLNCEVDWDDENRMVIIKAPENINPTEINSIQIEEDESSYRIVVQANDVIKSTSSFAYEEPERYGIDICNASYPERIGEISAENDVFYGVRFSQFDNDTVRIVVDLKEKVAGKVKLSDDRTEVIIDFDKVKEEENNDESNEEGDEPLIPELDWRASGKLIVIDVGHGGSDPGAQAKLNGKVIREKDLNLTIALRIYELLQKAGANVTMLRDKDVYMSLYSRPEGANSLNADLLVSVHNNAATKSSPNGTEVLYYNKEDEKSIYGFTSQEVAELIQKELVVETGLKDRGIIDCPHLAVLNKSLMPAVIIEGGFLSNPNDLQHMVTEEFKEAYAISVVRGVINALNSSVEN